MTGCGRSLPCPADYRQVNDRRDVSNTRPRFWVGAIVMRSTVASIERRVVDPGRGHTVTPGLLRPTDIDLALPGRGFDLIADIWAAVPLDPLDLPQTGFLGNTLGSRVAKPDQAHESR
jgi:hypothetical protein